MLVVWKLDDLKRSLHHLIKIATYRDERNQSMRVTPLGAP